VVKGLERGVDSGMFFGGIFVEHEAADDGEGEGSLGLGIGLVGAGGSQQLGELGKPVVDAFATESWEPVGLGLGEGVDLIKKSKEAAVGGIGDDRAQRRDQAAQISGVFRDETTSAGGEQLAPSVGKSRCDQGIAGAEVMYEHPRAGLELVGEISKRDLAALSGYQYVGGLGAQTRSLFFVPRTTRSCNVVTRNGFRTGRHHSEHRARNPPRRGVRREATPTRLTAKPGPRRGSLA
jgi:hypothetical protein